MRESSHSHHLYKVVGIVIALAATVFFVVFAIRNFEAVPPMDWGTTSIAVWAASVALVVFSIGMVGSIWWVLLRDYGVTTSWKRTQAVFAVAQFGKYLPGNVGHYVGRVFLAREEGMPVLATVGSMVTEALWGVGVAAALSLVALLLFLDSAAQQWLPTPGPIEVTLLVVIIVAAPWVAVRFVNAFLPGLARRVSEGGKIPEPRPQTALLVSGLFVACFLVTGLVLKLQAQWLFGVADVNYAQLTFLFAVAWVAGYVTPGAPGGMGVREAMMVLLLPPVVGTGVAVGLGIALRITTTVGDGAAFLIGIAMRHRLGKSHSEGES